MKKFNIPNSNYHIEYEENQEHNYRIYRHNEDVTEMLNYNIVFDLFFYALELKNKLKEANHLADTKEMELVESILKANKGYIVASLDGKGHFLGEFKGLSQDADGNLIIDTNLESIDCSGNTLAFNEDKK